LQTDKIQLSEKQRLSDTVTQSTYITSNFNTICTLYRGICI